MIIIIFLFSESSKVQAQSEPNQNYHLLVSFGLSWFDKGNETLGGSVVCGILNIPCPLGGGIVNAEKYIKTDGSTADLVQSFSREINGSRIVSETETDIVLVNSSVYCIRSSVPSYTWEPLYLTCPKVIENLSPTFTANQEINVAVNSRDSILLKYNLTNGANLNGVAINPNSKTLTLAISSPLSNGTLTLQLPRQLIDARAPRDSFPLCWSWAANGTKFRDYCYIDSTFAVIVNNNVSSFGIERTGYSIPSDSRVLIIGYPVGESIIEVQGTTTAPEFGQSMIMINFNLLAGIIAIVGISTTTLSKGRRL